MTHYTMSCALGVITYKIWDDDQCEGNEGSVVAPFEALAADAGYVTDDCSVFTQAVVGSPATSTDLYYKCGLKT